MRLDLRQLVEDRLRQFALFKIENPVIPEQKPTTILVVVFVGIEAFAAFFNRLRKSPAKDDCGEG